ncbi:MAG: ATP-binding cassette domain-containing protein [Anaerolineaceae bacterium]|nr:ATP-binding cassette domain-containing protein [Anaerolineaceae bacterium]
MKIVNMDSISKIYNGAEALGNVSLEIAEGERIVILGPSGCGKTTILRLIAGFIAPDTGSISIGGELVSKNGRIIKPPEQRNLGMVFQDLALWPHLSVKGNIEFGLKAKGVQKSEREERIRTILNLVGMADYADRKPAELSGGQQQRVALARALVLEPNVLLMDEPLSSLDLELNVRLRKEILRLQKTLGVTLLYVTHDHDEAFDIATRVVSMKRGRIEDVRTVSSYRDEKTQR